MTFLFSTLAKEEFSFLLDRGFSLIRDCPGEVCFQSTDSVVCVTWDKRSGELDVYLKLLRDASEEKPYSLCDLLAMENKDLLEAREPFQIFEQERLRPFLRRLADDVSKYASKALIGDRLYFRRLSEYRSRQAQSLMENMRARQVRLKADEAWRCRDYEQVVKQYESMRDHLTSAEFKRLEIAKDRMRQK